MLICPVNYFRVHVKSIFTYFWSLNQDLTCGPGFPRIPGNPGAPWMPCPTQTEHKNHRQTVGQYSEAKSRTPKQTLHMHGSAQYSCYLLGPLCPEMLKRVRFCLHTQTNEEGLHKNFHKVDSTHLAKSFCRRCSAATKAAG